ncbi:Hsp20/alpha crystallin family protein [Virgibacillus ainsalahensis]
MSDFKPNRKRNEDFFQHVAKSFKDVFDHEVFSPIHGKFSPFRTDIIEKEYAYYVTAELPGFSKEDVTLSIEQDKLTIHAKREKQEQHINDQAKVVRRERHYGEFVRQFHMDNMQEDGITAKLEDGILHVKIPKLNPEKTTGKQVDID